MFQGFKTATGRPFTFHDPNKLELDFDETLKGLYISETDKDAFKLATRSLFQHLNIEAYMEKHRRLAFAKQNSKEQQEASEAQYYTVMPLVERSSDCLEHSKKDLKSKALMEKFDEFAEKYPHPLQ